MEPFVNDIVEDIIRNNIKPVILDVDSFKNAIDVHKKIFNILHLNIRSIRQNFDNLLTFLETYNCNYSDIIVLSECWKVENPSNFNLPGYNCYYNLANFNKNDGLFIFVKTDIVANFNDFKFEQSGITLTRVSLTINNVSYAINALYRPPSTDVKLFLRELDDYFSNNLEAQMELFIGDININLNVLSNVAVEYGAILDQYGFCSYINCPTRIDKSTESCIDHIFLRKKLKTNILKFQSYIIQSSFTDHFPIMLNIYNQNDISTPVGNGLNGKSVVIVDHKKLDTYLKSENWETVTTNNNPISATKTFINILQNFINTSSNTKLLVDSKKLKPWITTGIIASIRHRDTLKKN